LQAGDLQLICKLCNIRLQRPDDANATTWASRLQAENRFPLSGAML
jgi:hypothetical protein